VEGSWLSGGPAPCLGWAGPLLVPLLPGCPPVPPAGWLAGGSQRSHHAQATGGVRRRARQRRARAVRRQRAAADRREQGPARRRLSSPGHRLFLRHARHRHLHPGVVRGEGTRPRTLYLGAGSTAAARATVSWLNGLVVD
jgi:hypothetical protein